MKRLTINLPLLLLGVFLAAQTGRAQLFQQQFSNAFGPLLGTSSIPVYLSDASYVSATPSNSQFNYICATGSSVTQYMSVAVDGGVLVMDRVSAGNGALIRNTPFPGPPTSLLVKFDFDVRSYRRGQGGTSVNYINFNVGTTFDTAAGRPSGGFAKFGIGFYRSTDVDSFWYVNNINSGVVPGTGHYRSPQTITFAVNNSGGQIAYTGPGATSETVADKTWDLWVGSVKEFDDQPANDASLTLSAFKIVFGSQSNTITFDNLLIDPLVATGVNDALAVPAVMKLGQNFPNPFNPVTTIRYEIAGTGAATSVRLAVYDLIGREVAILVNEQKAPGRYEVRLDGTGLASGVYLYRLSAGGNVATRKFVLMR